jgi:hypothetical protein
MGEISTAREGGLTPSWSGTFGAGQLPSISGIAIELLSCHAEGFREVGKLFVEKRKPVFEGR